MHFKLTRAVGESLSLVLADLFHSNMDTADVALVCSDQTVLKAHKCILSISPVLRDVLMCVDCRLDKVAYISMASFDKEDVQSFLHFLYKGFIDMNSSNKNILKIFRALNVNPPVLRRTKTKGFVNIEEDDDLIETNPCAQNIDEDEAKFKIIIDTQNNYIESSDSLNNVDCMEDLPVDTVSNSDAKQAGINQSSEFEGIVVQKQGGSSSQVSDLGSKASKCQEMLNNLPPLATPRFKLSKKLKKSRWIIFPKKTGSSVVEANQSSVRRMSTRKKVKRFSTNDMTSAASFKRFPKFKSNVSKAKKSSKVKVKGKLFCVECKKSVMAHNFKRHMNDVHGSKKGSVSCQYCNSLFKNKNSRQVHLRAFCSVLKSKK